MSDWPDVAVIIPTYNRVKILIDTIWLLEKNLHYSGQLHYFIGNDGDESVRHHILGFKLGSDTLVRIGVYDGPRRTYKDSNRFAGLGANLNMLIDRAYKWDIDYLFQMDDDHHLVKPMDLDPHMVQLMDHEDAGWIRLMGISHHHYTATLKGHYWYVHWDSEGDYSLYIPSNRPHLKHRRFHDFYGMYPEGKKLGVTEETFCHQCRNVWRKCAEDANPPSVLVPLNSNSESAWKHVGESWQSKGE